MSHEEYEKIKELAGSLKPVMFTLDRDTGIYRSEDKIGLSPGTRTLLLEDLEFMIGELNLREDPLLSAHEPGLPLRLRQSPD